MKGLSISPLMLRSWLRMLYSKNTGHYMLEVTSMHSKKVGRKGMRTESL